MLMADKYYVLLIYNQSNFGWKTQIQKISRFFFKVTPTLFQCCSAHDIINLCVFHGGCLRTVIALAATLDLVTALVKQLQQVVIHDHLVVPAATLDNELYPCNDNKWMLQYFI